jgi:hypothetical protein
MACYGSKHPADAFRTVRTNTMAIAKDIPEEKSTTVSARHSHSVAELLVHLLPAPSWQLEVYGHGLTTLVRFLVPITKARAEVKLLRSKELK